MMKKGILILSLLLILTGCSAVRIDTKSIDNILNVILTKDNKLFNQVGNGYKYYLPSGVIYMENNDLNDILYSNGTYYYLYVDTINYYYKTKNNYTEKKDLYYSKVLSTEDGFKYQGYLEIEKRDELYYIVFWYNYAKIETIVPEKELNNTVLNASYILSTIKYNYDVVDLMLKEDYFTKKTGKYNNYNSVNKSEKFKLENNQGKE